MQTSVSHLLFNVDAADFSFYRDLYGFLGWNVLYEDTEVLGMSSGPQSIWFGGEPKTISNDYDGPGLNHMAVGTTTSADVDAAATYLQEREVALLFETPRHRPEFSASDAETYYQIMFESPDRILFEVVYTGPKAA